MKNIIRGIIAGIEISLGGIVFLSCDNKVIGAMIFALTTFCICNRGDLLYTARIGYVVDNFNKKYWSEILCGLLGNIIGAVSAGVALRIASPDLIEHAKWMCDVKFEVGLWEAFTKGILCGVLLFLAVDIFKKKHTPIAILICIPAFILAKFEHCIADAFCFAFSGLISSRAVIFIIVVTLGNSVGGCILLLMRKLVKKGDK